MDKFGIFNLLSTALGSFNKKQEDTEPKTEDINDKLDHTTAPIPLSKSKPLQEQMLNTISSHENFVKRVYNSQKNTSN